MEERLRKIEKELDAIKERNSRVEANKAWETSTTRASSILFITYLVMLLFMRSLGVERYWANALVPALGFFLSIQSLPFIKRWWIKRYHP